ncbi:MAG: oligosaccharide flippase family protein [Methylomonas sp.]|jgi:O-antigen/teichoic acid export membrane protein
MEKQTSFAKRILNAGSWSVVGYGAGQVIRFGSNLILTRLLYPEAFGIMAIIQAVMTGLVMLSDFGIPHYIIRREREPEPDFLNTAWTVQIFQGILIGIIFSVIPPLVASFYSEPLIAQIMPIVGLNAVISGFNSTKTATLSRQISIKTTIIFELITAFTGTAIIIIFAWLMHSVWALVWGFLAGTMVRMLASHAMLEGIRHRIAWHKNYVRELVDFGKWIIVRSSLTFVDGEGNKLIMGAFLGVRTLSFFNLASTMNLMVSQLVQAISGRLLIPVYSEILRERPARINAVLAKCRLVFIGSGWLAAIFFIILGKKFMGFLFDPRYADSGKILQVLAMGSLLGNLNGSYSHLLTAMGRIRASTFLLIIKIVVQLACIFTGYYLFGEGGVIFGVALGEWLYYPLNTFYYARIGFWQPKIDLPFLAFSLIIISLMALYSDVFQLLFEDRGHEADFLQFMFSWYEKGLSGLEYILKYFR